MSVFQQAFHSVPPVTRFMLVSIVLVTGSVLLQQVSFRTIYLSWSQIIHSYEVWRPWTAFFYVGGGFPAIYDFFLIFRNGSSLEEKTYLGRTAEYAWANIMIAIFIMLLGFPLNLVYLFRSLLHAQNYLWCRANPTMAVSLFGLLTIPVPYYPAALIGLDFILGGPMKAIGGGVGLLAGHTWWFLSTYLPSHPNSRLRRANPLRAPAWFKGLFGKEDLTQTVRGQGFEFRRGGMGAGVRREDGGSSATTTSHNWGSGGQKLGGGGL